MNGGRHGRVANLFQASRQQLELTREISVWIHVASQHLALDLGFGSGYRSRERRYRQSPARVGSDLERDLGRDRRADDERALAAAADRVPQDPTLIVERGDVQV